MYIRVHLYLDCCITCNVCLCTYHGLPSWFIQCPRASRIIIHHCMCVNRYSVSSLHSF